MITIRSYYIHTIPEELYRKCYRNNFGDAGCIRGDLVHLKRIHPSIQRVHRIYVAFIDDTFVGWGLTQSIHISNTQFNFQCWVLKKFRRRGIAKRILRKHAAFIKKYETRVLTQVFPHDEDSCMFYKNENLLLIDDIIPKRQLKKGYRLTA